MSDELRRLETLERLVRSLAHEVAELRADVRAARDGRPDPAPRERTPLEVMTREPVTAPGREPLREPIVLAAADARVQPREERIDLEKLAGRYGTVALAVLTIVMGVGVFLRWAIEHVDVGPVQRVGLGALAALAIGALGWRLRARGAKQYGDMLVGLALALVHVVAWGAGPYLRVVPDTVALVIAAAASVFLAALAWHEREQPLFAAGLGGAFLAPFVTTRSGGVPEMLLGYAAPIVISGTLALRRGDWRVARRILAMGTLLFAGTALATLPEGTAWTRLAEGPAFALAAAVVAQLLAGEGHRRALAYTNLGSALVVLAAFAAAAPPAWVAASLGLVGALVAAIASRGEGDATGGTFELAISNTGTFTVGEDDGTPIPWVGAVGFPLAFMGVALSALRDPATREGGAVALAFAALALALAAWRWRAGMDRRGAHLVTCGVATVVAVVLALHPTPVTMAGALVATGVVASVAAARTATPLALVPGLIAMGLATATAAVQLAARPAWRYAPFATTASLAALACVAAWFVVAHETELLARLRDATSATPSERAPREDGAVLRTVAWLAAFGWGHEELAHAWSPPVATFALVTYYALTGVVTIGAGRHRGSATARKVGLALAMLAGLKAVLQASSITAIGLRVGSYLLVGGFLLGVAWWYRKGADGTTAGDDTPIPATGSPDTPDGIPPVARLTMLLVLAVASLAPARMRAQPSDTSRISTRPLFTSDDAWIAGAFVVGSIAMHPFDRAFARRLQTPGAQERRLVQHEATALRLIGEPGSLIIGASLYGAGRAFGNARMADLGLHGTEAILVGLGVTAIGKTAFGRARPYANVDDPNDWGFGRGLKDDKYRSFPSGHSTMGFAAAAAVSAETMRWWPDTRWFIGPAMYGGAALIGVSRMYNNKHWASDVVTGAAIGTVAGLKVVRYSHSRPGNRVDRWLLGARVTPGEGVTLSVMPTSIVMPRR